MMPEIIENMASPVFGCALWIAVSNWFGTNSRAWWEYRQFFGNCRRDHVNWLLEPHPTFSHRAARLKRQAAAFASWGRGPVYEFALRTSDRTHIVLIADRRIGLRRLLALFVCASDDAVIRHHK
jgi:hypothetical protein